jgi:hypothetical protein
MTTDDIVSPAERTFGKLPHATIAQLYPDVSRVLLFVAVEEAGAEGEPSYQQIIFARETEASFRLDCSRDDCAGGGFDFSPFVGPLINASESRGEGKLTCHGWIGGGKGKHCGLKAEYRIIVEYAD